MTRQMKRNVLDSHLTANPSNSRGILDPSSLTTSACVVISSRHHAIQLLRKLGDDGNYLRDQVAKFWLSSNMGVPY